MLEVGDTRAGIDEVIQSRNFNPFYSTEGINQGTGLGLATVYGIIKQSCGHIEVASKLGEGSPEGIEVQKRKINALW